MIANQSLPVQNSDMEAHVATEQAPAKTKSGKRILNRDNLLRLTKCGELMFPMVQYVRANGRRFIQYGVRGAANLKSVKPATLLDAFIYKLPGEAFTVIDEWLVEQTVPELNKFLESHSEDTLREMLLGMHLFLLGLTSEPADSELRARLMIACNYDCRYHGLFTSLIKAEWDSRAKKGASRYDNIQKIALDPKIVLLNQDMANHVLSWLIACAVAIHLQQREIADALLEKLRASVGKRKEHSLLKALDEHYDQVMAQGPMPAVKMGVARTGEFDSLVDIEVLAQCTKSELAENNLQLPYAFSKVLAVKHKNSLQWKELTQEQAQQMFPKLGSIIHFYGKQYPALPDYRSYAVWRVDQHQQRQFENENGRAESIIHPTARVMPVQQVSIPDGISSAQMGELKSWLKLHSSMFTSLPVDEAKLLYVSDGVFIHPAVSYTKTFENNFTKPFRAWRQLQIHQLSTGLNLHIGELPSTNIQYDLADAKEIVIRSLKQYVKLNKQELDKLDAIFAELKDNEHYMSLIKEFGVEKLQWRLSEFEKLASKLMQVASISKATAHKESKLLKTTEAENAKLQSELETVRNNTEQTKRRIAERLKQLEQTPDKLDAMIEKYFDRIRHLSNRFIVDSAAKRKWFPEIADSLDVFRQRADEMQSKVNSLNENVDK